MCMFDVCDYMGGVYDLYGGMEGGYGFVVGVGVGIGVGFVVDYYNYGESVYSFSDYFFSVSFI